MNCKNCNNLLKQSQKFCDECGAKVIENRLTLKALFQQVNEQFLSIDNKFLQTAKCLITKPEAVIDGYINGVRKKYINVITFYAIALTTLGFQMFLLKQFFPEFIDFQNTSLNEGFQAGAKGSPNPFENFGDTFNNYQGVIFSAFMPFMAIGTWLLFMDKKQYNYTEHLVINLYLTAQTIFFSFIFVLLFALFGFSNYMVFSMIITIPVVLYCAYVFKKLYKISYFNSLIRYIAAYAIYTIALFIILIIVVIIAFVYLYVTGKINLN